MKDFIKFFKEELNGMAILRNISNFICGFKYGTAMRIKEIKKGLAYTDGRAIYINLANRFIDESKDDEERLLILNGLVAHEAGHVRYTDFVALGNMCRTLLEEGEFYEKPKLLSGDRVNLQKLNKLMKESKYARIAVKNLSSELDNIIDDEWMEGKVKAHFTGDAKKAVELCRTKLKKTDKELEIERLMDIHISPIQKVKSICFEIVRCDSDGHLFDTEFNEFADDIRPYLEEAVKTDDSSVRQQLINGIIVHAFPLIGDALNQKDEGKSDSESDSSSKSDSNPKSEPSSENEPDDKNSSENEDSSQAEETTTGGEEELSEEEQERLEKMTSDSAKRREEISEDENSLYNIESLRKEAEEMSKPLDLKEEVGALREAKEASKLKKEILKEISKVKMDEIHKDCIIKVNTDNFAELNEIYGEGGVDAKGIIRAQKKSINNIKKNLSPLFREEDCLEEGIFFGDSICRSKISSQDGKMMQKEELPSEERKLAVAILADQSGSMAQYARENYLQKACITMYEACKGLNIPLAIWGHGVAYDNGENHLNVFCEFDKTTKQDIERLTYLRSYCYDNRDGLPIKLLGEHLSKRREENKLLIILSDGEPRDSTSIDTSGNSLPFYYGEDAKVKADIRHQLSYLKRKGVNTFVGAIGDDKEAIKDIYGLQRYMNITDMSQMAKTLSRLLQRYLQ